VKPHQNIQLTSKISAKISSRPPHEENKMEHWLQGFLTPQVLQQRVRLLGMAGYVSGGAAIVAVLSLPFLR